MWCFTLQGRTTIDRFRYGWEQQWHCHPVKEVRFDEKVHSCITHHKVGWNVLIVVAVMICPGDQPRPSSSDDDSISQLDDGDVGEVITHHPVHRAAYRERERKQVMR